MSIEGTDNSGAASLHLHRLNMEGLLPFKGDEQDPKKQVRNIHWKTMNPSSYEKWSCV